MDEQERLLINRLIIGISKKKEKDLEQLFHLTKNQLYVLAKECVKDSNIANEVLSQGYFQIYRKSRTFNPHENDGYEWICRIIKDIAKEYSEKITNKN